MLILPNPSDKRVRGIESFLWLTTCLPRSGEQGSDWYSCCGHDAKGSISAPCYSFASLLLSFIGRRHLHVFLEELLHRLATRSRCMDRIRVRTAVTVPRCVGHVLFSSALMPPHTSAATPLAAMVRDRAGTPQAASSASLPYG